MIINLLSFDLEEYFHGMAFHNLSPSDWNGKESRVQHNVEKLLAVLGNQKATFFVVGWIAKKYPELVKKLHQEGHEIGCHGFLHKCIWDMSPQEFSDDLKRARDTIETTINSKIYGFRAPTFSITEKTLWAIDKIRNAGFKYDSSIFPIIHDRYGIPDAPRLPYRLSDNFWEIPLSTVKIGGINIPFGGGGYLRLYPYWFTNLLIKKNNREGLPVVVYQHPWELDKANLAKPKTFLARLRRNFTVGETQAKLARLLAEHHFVPIMEWIKEQTQK